MISRRLATPIAIAASGALALGACSSGAVAEETRGQAPFVQLDSVDPALQEQVIAVSDTLGFDLMAAGDPAKNIVVSPASFTMAFAMLAPGATGAGATEMERLLGAPVPDAVDTINVLMGVLSKWDGDPTKFDAKNPPENPFFHLANRVVLDKDFNPNQDYLDALSRSFDAGTGIADLSSSSAKPMLDEWVARHTANLIKESAIQPDEGLVLALQNAVLFGARWAVPFTDTTVPATFTPTEGAPFEVDMMKKDIWVQYAELEGWKAIALPYTDGFTAVFVLPPEGTDPLAADQGDVAGIVSQLQGDLAATETVNVEINIPQIDTKASTELVPILKELGYSAIFSAPPAPLAGIGDGDLVVGQAVQQAVLKVNEEGTIAAAVTEIGVSATGMPAPPEFKFIADRPFLMIVVENSTGWDLFQAAIRDPRS